MTEGTAKPTVSSLGIDLGALNWRRSGETDGCVEIAFVAGARGAGAGGGRSERRGTEWVLMRVAGDPEGRVLVYDRNEWVCFLDGVRGGEFDDAAG